MFEDKKHGINGSKITQKSKFDSNLECMLKNILFILIAVLFFISCVTNKEKEGIVWYNSQVIEQLEAEGDSAYRIQIGIMASAFWLDRQHKNFESYFSLLQHSLTQRDSLDIGIEKNSNKIIAVKTKRLD